MYVERLKELRNDDYPTLKLIEIDLNSELKLLNKRMTNFDAAIETTGMYNDLFKRKKDIIKQLKYIQKQKRRFWACLAILLNRIEGDTLNGKISIK